MCYREEDIKEHIYQLWLIMHKDPELYTETFKEQVQKLYETYGADNIYKKQYNYRS